ncbi:MAG: hypothetical protein J5705_06720 [Bacteroidaceae bacterium]|nr:hypothetical protein [Bacteroidaceae bacterium]
MFATLFISHYSKRAGYHLVLILVMAMLLTGCSHVNDGMVRGRRAITALMDSAESIVDENASLADSLMQLIDSHSIHNRGQRARYALLSTQAQYKNYRLITTDSLIMEAVRYYSINKNLNYRFLSYYYLGCAYMDMERNTDASVALAQAERMVDQIDNDYWKGLLYSNLGRIFYYTLDYPRSEDYFLKAASCFECANKDYHHIYALYDKYMCEIGMLHFREGDSIAQIIQKWATENEDSYLTYCSIMDRFICYLHLNDENNAVALYNEYVSKIDDFLDPAYHYERIALYYNLIGECQKSVEYMNKVWSYNLSYEDSIFCYYINSLIAKKMGQADYALECFNQYTSLQNDKLRSIIWKPILGAQKDYYRTVAELEQSKAHNKITMLVSSIIILSLIVFLGLVYNRNKRLETQKRIGLYLSTIEELTTQVSVDQNKISNLNSQVREMFRQQFSSSDFLYTRYYEQIDDSKKAERLYRIVKNQIDDFTSHKNVGKIDELLNGTFDGVMDDLLSSGLDLKEKDLLLLRFVLAGFSAKSIATLLNDTHPNINQRKKRLLDKIAIVAPDLMEKLRNALNTK